MSYLSLELSSIIKGKAKPVEIEQFLDRLLDLVCEVGFSDLVLSLFSSIRKFESEIFKYDETCNHIIRELL